MPKEHPVAWASQLWPHIRLIQIMRRERKTWVEITQHLESRHNVKVTFRTVRNFFKRATDPDRKRPLGFPALSEAPPGATLPPEFKERYLRESEEAKAPAIKPLPTIDPDDD